MIDTSMWKFLVFLSIFWVVANAKCIPSYIKSFPVDCNTRTCDNCGSCSETAMFCGHSDEELADRFNALPGEVTPITGILSTRETKRYHSEAILINPIQPAQPVQIHCPDGKIVTFC